MSHLAWEQSDFRVYNPLHAWLFSARNILSERNACSMPTDTSTALRGNWFSVSDNVRLFPSLIS